MIGAITRIALAALISLGIAPLAVLAMCSRLLGAALATRSLGAVTRLWCRAVAAGLGVRLRVRGPAPPRPALLAPNHVSYVDVLAVGSVAGCAFVSRADVAGWPGIGWLARLGGTVFLERARRRDTHRATDDVRRVLASGGRLVVFLEGRAGPGDRVGPFHSSFLEAAVQTGTACVPVAVSYRLPRRPDLDTRQVVAWHDASLFVAHAWRLLRAGPIEADVHVGTPRTGTDRKELAAALEADVAALLGAARVSADRSPAPTARSA